MVARAAREVGVHERTGRDWRDGIRKVGKTRIYPDGTVVDYRTGGRYRARVNTSGRGALRAVNTRCCGRTDIDYQPRFLSKIELTMGESPTMAP
jgi:hypothetical protein